MPPRLEILTGNDFDEPAEFAENADSAWDLDQSESPKPSVAGSRQLAFDDTGLHEPPVTSTIARQDRDEVDDDEEDSDDNDELDPNAVAEPVSPVTENMTAIRSRIGGRRGKKKSVFLEMFKVLFGGLLAVPAAQMILLWMPGDWELSQRDPVGGAVHIANYAPFLVPDKLRAELLKGSGEDAGLASADKSPQTSREIVPGEDAKFDTKAAADALVNNLTEPAAAQDQSSSEPKVPPDEPPAMENPVFDEAWASAEAANASWDAASKPTADQHRELYRTVAKLAETIDTVDPADRVRLGRIREFASAIAANPNKRDNVLGAAASSWLRLVNRTSEGIFLVGTVTGFEYQGNWLEFSLQLSSADRRIVVAVAQKDRELNLKMDSRCSVLGRIVKRPFSSLEGYSGSSNVVIHVGVVTLIESADESR